MLDAYTVHPNTILFANWFCPGSWKQGFSVCKLCHKVTLIAQALWGFLQRHSGRYASHSWRMVVASALASVCFSNIRLDFDLNIDYCIDYWHRTCDVFCWTHGSGAATCKAPASWSQVPVWQGWCAWQVHKLGVFAQLVPPTSSQHMANIVSLKVSLEQTAWVLGHHFKSRCGFLNLNVWLGRLGRVGNPRQPGHWECYEM